VALFLWKACTNILPRKENLYKCGIVSDLLCPICGLAPETVGHVLWSCLASKDVWLGNMVRIQMSTCDENDFINIVEKLMRRLGEEEMQQFVFMARQVWFRRNKFIFEDEFDSLVSVNITAHEQLDLFEAAEIQSTRSMMEVVTKLEMKWEKPPCGWLKLNWDASIEKNGRKMKVGIVIRDQEGALLVANCITKIGLTNPSVAEAMGAWQSASLINQLGLQKVIVEGDALQVIQDLQKKGPCWRKYGHLIDDVKNMIPTDSNGTSVMFIVQQIQLLTG
jgi:hypothetical protein